MQMITNYLNSLESYLPEELRKEVRDELESSIHDQLEDLHTELGRQADDSEQEALLRRIGHPMRVAASYLPHQQLVSSEYFPAFKRALEISVTIVSIITLLAAIPFIFAGDHIIISAISLLWELVDRGLWMFAIVTIIFYLMQKNGTSIEGLYTWSPKEIRESEPKLRFSRLETLFEMAVTVLFLAWWNDQITLPATVNVDQIVGDVSLSPEWQSVLWATNIIMGLVLLIGAHKLLIAGWKKTTLVANIVANVASLVVIFLITRFEQMVVISSGPEVPAHLTNTRFDLEATILIILGIIATLIAWDCYSCISKLLRR